MRLVSVFLAAVANATMKLADGYGARLIDLLIFRQAGTLLLVLVLATMGPGLASLKTRRLGAHIARSTVGLTGMTCIFAALLVLPLSEATTIQFTVPMAATLLSAIILGEAVGWRRWIAVMIGFVGVLMLVQPGSVGLQSWGALLAIIGAFFTAGVLVLLRRIGQTEAALTTVFWFSILSLIVVSPFYAILWRPHSPHVWALLIAAGIIGGANQLTMTAALRFAPVSVIVPMDYTALIWAILFSWLLFDRLPGPAIWIGAPLIICSGLMIVWREHVLGRERTERAIV
ncbi:DMT family transporter [Sphingomonas sp. Root1294]|uniref:DMT family transporter n=1 Tax=Sphingomonas sp. Root1294 TaxID=1736447 RepID=UPI001F2F8A1A|nr:DMT family transporter [Sphingomonas sp. Root1294]